MNTVTANGLLEQSLAGLGELTEIRDSAGNVIGYFSPSAHNAAAVSSQAAAHFDPGEMKRRKDSGDEGLTTADVLKRLESLEQ